MTRTPIASIFLVFLTILMLSTYAMHINAWSVPTSSFNYYVQISKEKSDSEDIEKSQSNTEQENNDDSKTETSEGESTEEEQQKTELANESTEEEQQKTELANESTEEEQQKTELANESTEEEQQKTELVNESTEEEQQKTELANESTEEEQQKTELANESTEEEQQKTELANESTEEEQQKTELANESTEEEQQKTELVNESTEEEQQKTELVNEQSKKQGDSFNQEEQKSLKKVSGSDKTDERLQTYLHETMNERYDQDLCRHHDGVWDFNSKQCQIQDPNERKAYEKESKETSRYDQALCGDSGTWNAQNNMCEINDLDEKTDYEDTLCDDSRDSVLYDACNYERYKDNRSQQIKDYDRIQCTNFNGKWDDKKAMCETDDVELQKYLNERHDIYSCINAGHEWNYNNKECKTTHSGDKKSTKIKNYDIKVIIKNPDRLDTERDATVKTKIDYATEELHILKKTESTVFKDINGNPGKKVTACIEGSKKIEGDCGTKKLPYNDDSLTIKLTIELK